MTESLTDRLQKRLSTQTAEIEALTRSELTQLAANLRQQCIDELSTMQNDIQHTASIMARELRIVTWTGRWMWIALIATWLLITVFLIWLWMLPRPGIGMYQTFTADGQTFLILPEGTEATTCRRTSTNEQVQCVTLPRGN